MALPLYRLGPATTSISPSFIAAWSLIDAWHGSRILITWSSGRCVLHGRMVESSRALPRSPLIQETSSQFKAGMFGPVTAKREPESRIFIAGIYIRA